MLKLEIVMKKGADASAFSVLGADGAPYVMYFRLKVLGFNTGWKTVPFVSVLPA